MQLRGLHRFVRLKTELFVSEGGEQGTRTSRRRFGRIWSNRKVLIRGADRERWWEACERRRRSELRRFAARLLIIATIVTAFAIGFGILIGERSEELRILKHFATGDVDSVLAGAGGKDQNREILRAVEKILPHIEDTPEDPILIGTVTWAMDYYPAHDQDPLIAANARALRRKVLGPLRRMYVPPDVVTLALEDIPAGSFLMGSDDILSDDCDERPVHEVTLKGFRILAHEVANRDYRRLFPDHEGHNDNPVVSVTWYQAYTYAAWLGGRLPTEAEWEYAARAGCPSDYCIKDDGQIMEANVGDVGWHAENSGGRLHQIGEKPPNPWGLYDMYGNVLEWVADWYAEYSPEEQYAPGGPASGELRVMRGNGFRNPSVYAHAAHRVRYHPGVIIGNVGFRVVFPSE